MLVLLLEECIHDRLLHKIERDLQCLSKKKLSDFNNIQKSCIHTKFTQFCLVVTAFQFVLHIVAIENSDMLGHHSPKERLS